MEDELNYSNQVKTPAVCHVLFIKFTGYLLKYETSRYSQLTISKYTAPRTD